MSLIVDKRHKCPNCGKENLHGAYSTRYDKIFCYDDCIYDYATKGPKVVEALKPTQQALF